MTVLDARLPTRAPGVELLGTLSGSGYAATPGLVRRGDGQTVQLTPLLFELMAALDGRRSADQLASALSSRTGRDVSADDVRFLLEEKLAPLGLLATADGGAPEVRKADPLLGLKLKVVVSDPAVTRRLTAPFTWLFRWYVVVPVLLAFVATSWWVLWERGLAQATRQAFYEPGLLLAVFALTVLSAGFHEFGHAAACRAAGATPGAMGAGLYLVWPAFYTDVDDSYRLGRWRRLQVDLGGLYFNAIVAVAVTGVWLWSRQDALLLGVATQLLQMVRQLAPVIRADGYHILADLVGVPDLFAHLKPTLTGLLPRNWGKPQPLQRWARAVVAVWVLVVVPVLLGLALLCVLLLPRLLATAWTGLARQADLLQAAAESADLAGVVARVLSALALLLPVLAIGYLLARVARRAYGAVWRATENRPVARPATILLGACAAAALVWAWWPNGQYQPVRSDERGSLPAVLQPHHETVHHTPQLQALADVQPQPALALVPRGEAARTHPTLLLTRDAGGQLRNILLTDAAAGRGVAFPFARPPLPAPGDNQAVAVNDKDGTTVYDVAAAVVWVRDGAPATQRNEAYALASCRACTTVAVAFQVVLVVGQSDVVAPINSAVAANGACVECVTRALAVQLVVTLKEAPTQALAAEIEQAVARIGDVTGLTDVYAEIQAVEQEVLALLADNDLLSTPAPATPTPSASASSTPSTPASPDSSPSAGAPTPPAESPDAAMSPEPSPEPSSTEPSPAESPATEPSPAAS